MIKAKDLIKKEHKDVYVLCEEVYVNLDEACKQAAIKKVYESLRKKYILHHSIPKWDKECVDILNCRSKKLATRLEREFLRGNEYIGVIELIYTESSDIDDIFNESVFFKGEINIKNINHLIKSFNSDKERLENIFKSEYGTYHFGVIENAIADRYEFELIDFKPLEVSSE